MNRILILLAGVSLAAFGWVSPAGGSGEIPNVRVKLDIPAQPLDGALNDFADQAGLQLGMDAELSEQLQFQGLKGTFTLKEALKRLLAHTSLTVEFVDSTTISVRAGKKERRGTGVVVDPEKKPVVMAEVVITGTSIRGVAPVGSPVFTYTQQDFDRIGAATAQELLSALPQNFGGGPSDDTSTGGRIPGVLNDRTFGGTAANLRGLGPGSTLVLVNGRRLALSGAAQYVDISLIPLSAVERVEVLLDGASSIYGSDAVAGVVNFILFKDYEGFSTRLRTGTTTQGGLTEYQFAQSAGHKWNSGSLLLNYEFYQQHPIMDDQRKFTRGIPGNSDYISGETRNSLLLSTGQDLVNGLRVSFDGFYSNRIGKHYFFNPDEVTEDNDAGNTQKSGVVSLLWNSTSSWEARVDVGKSENRIDTTSNDVINDTLGSFSSRYDLRSGDGQIGGDLFSLPAGTVKIALGGGYRKEHYEIKQQDELVPIPFRRIGELKTGSAYVELRIPLLGEDITKKEGTGLVMSLAERYENYNSFGHRLNPKIGMVWGMSDSLKLRATTGKSFRAPSVSQLDSLTGVYILQNVNTANGIQRIISKAGNSSTLGPETSTSWTAGLDFKLGPSNKFDGKITWFKFDYKNRIAAIPGSALQGLTDPAFAPARILRSDFIDDDFNALVLRALSGQDYRVVSGCPAMYRTASSCGEPPANFIAIVDRGLRNLAATHETGMDVNLNRRFKTIHGLFVLDAGATYLFDFKRRITPLSPEIELVDTIYNPMDLRLTSALEWMRDNWDITARVNYSDGYANPAVSPALKVESWTTVDIGVRNDLNAAAGYLLKDVALVFNIRNLFDKDPPFVDTGVANAINYDAANADPYGRQVSLTILKKW